MTAHVTDEVIEVTSPPISRAGRHHRYTGTNYFLLVVLGNLLLVVSSNSTNKIIIGNVYTTIFQYSGFVPFVSYYSSMELLVR